MSESVSQSVSQLVSQSVSQSINLAGPILFRVFSRPFFVCIAISINVDSFSFLFVLS